MLKKIIPALLSLTSLVSTAVLAEDYTTTACRQYGQPEFVFSSGEKKLIEADAIWFKKTLEGMVASGERFKDGETMLVGPMVLKIKATQEGTYRLLEPDMKGMPFNFVDTVAWTLKIVRRQREAASSLEGTVALDFAPLHQPLLIEEGALQAPTIIMTRYTAKETGGTGWLIGVADQDNKRPASDVKPRAMSVYEAMLTRPDIVDFLALPPGYAVILKSRRDFLVVHGDKPAQIRKGSYLDLLKQ